jgi:urea carboxylase
VLADHEIAIDSQVAGSIWQWRVAEGECVEAGQVIAVLESMKMEIEVTTIHAGTVRQLCKAEGKQIGAGQRLLVLNRG